MEKFSDIISAIKNQQPVNPPDTIVDHVMAKLEKVDQSAAGRLQHFLLPQRIFSPDTAGNFTGRITSYQQCAFLLFMVGFFYLVAGVVTLWGFRDAIAGTQINPWLKIQPYITIASALFIIAAAVLMNFRPQTTAFIQYAMIIHTTFILVNAVILKSILSFPVALIYVLILTMLAIVFGVLLIGSIRSVLRFSVTR